MMTTNIVPRVLVGCLACYNAGDLVGVWLDAAADLPDDVAEFMDAHNAGTGRVHEEWHVCDAEGFGGWEVGRYANLVTVGEVGDAIAKHGAAFIAYLTFADDAEATSVIFEDAYIGEYDSLEAYAVENMEEHGVYAALEPFGSAVKPDVASFAHELEMSGDRFTVDSGHGTVFVFYGHV